MSPPDASPPLEDRTLVDSGKWDPFRYHAIQYAYFHSTTRFNVVPAGRRSGKTAIAKRRLVRKAMGPQRFGAGRYFYGAPTWRQVKNIAWRDLKSLVPRHLMRGRPSEGELVIPLVNGSAIYLFGLDQPARFEGQPWDHGVVDEVADCKEDVWGAHMRPALADRQGGCDFIGVPEGRNHFYKIDKEAIARQAEAERDHTVPEWRHFHWKSAEVLPVSEVEAMRRDMDEMTFRQEAEADFVDFAGRAYYGFQAATHAARPLRYRDDADLILMFDFNVSPGVCAIGQEQALVQPSGVLLIGTGIIGEVYIPVNSTTPAICRKIVNDWGKHKGRVFLYGDYTGGAKGTAKLQGSDWEIIRGELRPAFPGRVIDRVMTNPRERDRVNAVNSRLLNMTGEIKLMVDPAKAPHVVEDFEGVALLEGGSGEIDKDKNPMLSHLTDAIGYYVADAYPVVKREMIIGKAVG